MMTMEAIIQTLLTDSDCLLELCEIDFEEATDYQFDKNTHADSHFLQESLSAMEKSEEEIILVTDGGYDDQDNVALAKEKNVRLVTTALIGKESPDALADFEFNEDGIRLLRCAAGHEPASQTYTKTTKQCRVSFARDHCVGCPYQHQCRPKIYKKVATFITSRNGVETIPTNILKNYHLDKLPKGKQRGKFFFGSKISSLKLQKAFWIPKGLRELCAKSDVGIEIGQKYINDPKAMKSFIKNLL